MKKITLFLILISICVFAQPRNNQNVPIPNSFFSSEVILLPSNQSLITLYYPFKIPYNMLVFEREGRNYEANFRLQIEIHDSTGTLVTRDLKESKVKTEDFNLTTDRSTFLRGLLQLEVPVGKLELRATIADLNSDKELPLRPDNFNTAELFEKTVFPPIIVYTSKIVCDSLEHYSMANYGGSIPFSEDNFALLIPVTDTLRNKLLVTIINNDETIIEKEITESYLTNIELHQCKDEIILQKGEKTVSTRIFVLDKINKNLYEGPVKILIDKTEENEPTEFEKNVVWVNKPFSLRDPEMAIEYLKYIENPVVINDLLDKDESEYSLELVKHWAKYDPTPETSFNQLMQEYYERIDYAALEFRGIGKENGVNTDRGKIYIRFGKPVTTERTSDLSGNVVETWKYSDPERTFIFVDKKGTGNFTLVEG